MALSRELSREGVSDIRTAHGLRIQVHLKACI
jgi:hypothetical protein